MNHTQSCTLAPILARPPPHTKPACTPAPVPPDPIPQRAPSHATAHLQILTLPTVLTLLRVAAVPGLVAAWYSTAPWAAAACTALFVGASLTDYLDGYLARKMVRGAGFGVACGVSGEGVGHGGAWGMKVERGGAEWAASLRHAYCAKQPASFSAPSGLLQNPLLP